MEPRAEIMHNNDSTVRKEIESLNNPNLYNISSNYTQIQQDGVLELNNEQFLPMETEVL